MEISPEKVNKQPRNHITNTHQYLNFIKKNHRLAQAAGTNNQQEKNHMIHPPPLQVTKNNSVFVLKEHRKQYRVEKASNSLYKPTYHLKVTNNLQDTQYLSAQIINEIIDKKNKEIQASMYREKQCMSEIVYNYSQFRSMESQFYRLEKTKKKSQKITYKDKNKDSVKFPEVNKNNQDIFTIQYDAEGKKIVKVDLKRLDDNRLKQSGELILKQKSLSRDLKSVYTDKQFTKRNQLHLFKRRRHNNEFGIQIKSINNKILDSDNYLQNSGLKLRRQLYEIVPESDTKKQDRLRELRESEDKLLEVMKKQEIPEPAEIRQYKSQSVEFKMVSSKNILATSTYNPYKFSLKGLENNKEEVEQTRSIAQSSFKQEEGMQKEKEKHNQSLSKRQHNRKNIILHQKQFTVYDQKISSYRQFLFLMNLVHKKYDSLFLGQNSSFKSQDKYKYYIGLGNNSMLVKGLMKRRFWWIQEDDFKKANFAWTQLKITQFYQLQKRSERPDFDSKAQSNDNDLKKKKNLKKDSEIKSSLRGAALYKAPLPQDKDKILTNADKKILQILEINVPCSESADKIAKYSTKLKYWQHNPFSSLSDEKINEKMHNHLQFNHYIGNKKALYYNLKQYYELRRQNVFEIIPLTFHIREGTKDAQFAVFAKQFKRLQSLKYQQRKKKEKDSTGKKLKNVWIIKPGELSNRGNGIVVIDQLYEFVNILKKHEKHPNGDPKTYIVQKYIENPLLYKGRKFDIRHYMIITRLHGLMRAYWYGQGYIRTSSSNFDLDDVSDQMIHLTNDAIQKNSTFYGKHEEGNKLSYSEFQRYLDQTYPQEKISFAEHIYPKMKNIATDAIKSTYLQLDTNSLEHNFQIFGLDFMIDESFNVWLIEVNTNPCLELSSKLLGRIIPNMVEQALKLSIDVIFPPSVHYPNSQKYLAPDNTLGRLMYQLIFDEARDGKELVELFQGRAKIDYGGEVKEDQQVYENDGKQIELGADIN